MCTLQRWFEALDLVLAYKRCRRGLVL